MLSTPGSWRGPAFPAEVFRLWAKTVQDEISAVIAHRDCEGM